MNDRFLFCLIAYLNSSEIKQTKLECVFCLVHEDELEWCGSESEDGLSRDVRVSGACSLPLL